MNTPTRLAIFAAGLVAAFGAAWGVGTATDPLLDEPPAAHDMDGAMAHGDASHDDGGHLPGGLMVSQDGYALDLEQTTLRPGTRPVAFTITKDGHPVTAYDVEHEKQLHLIAVRRDGSGFQHVHPTMDDAGTWRTDLDVAPGAWRVFADFTPTGGEGLTLGADVTVPGRVDEPAPATPSRTARVDDYTVTLDGDLVAGAASDLTVTVTRDGEPVTDLEPYLGAYGHLVALRDGDLAYLHVHPEESGPGPDVPFVAEVPSAGDFHLYLDFQHDGVVRTAQFLVQAEGHDDDH
ncbi:hypothetical protein [Nocardioides currus]|uniref:Heavy metal-binding domain-containing protein n=1 Tax=Nocardioides currus TaxID=2133958 RepID=A0A2R7YY40_9ACTN|nr:hypothetical protein [Nocardioides currus]PUA81273.1 hypothetical protein C7S10_09595 [Nocardioides currus]